MKYILLISLLTSAIFAAPVAQQGKQPSKTPGAPNAQNGQNGNGRGQTQQQNGQQNQKRPTGGNGQKGTPSAADLATAVANWQADTSMVSQFLNTGAGIQNNVAFKQAATVALNAEIDELNHKAIIDKAVGTKANVIAANSTLVKGGSFQDVVDKLKIMSQQGRAAVANIDLINQNRCVNVLPNIDAYMAATGSKSQAVRPTACDQTGVIGGVQGNGATQPGGTPGTPQAAFTAAKAIAQGNGKGKAQKDNGQNGAANTGKAGATNAGAANAGAAKPGTGKTAGAAAGASAAKASSGGNKGSKTNN